MSNNPRLYQVYYKGGVDNSFSYYIGLAVSESGAPEEAIENILISKGEYDFFLEAYEAIRCFGYVAREFVRHNEDISLVRLEQPDTTDDLEKDVELAYDHDGFLIENEEKLRSIWGELEGWTFIFNKKLSKLYQNKVFKTQEEACKALVLA